MSNSVTALAIDMQSTDERSWQNFMAIYVVDIDEYVRSLNRY